MATLLKRLGAWCIAAAIAIAVAAPLVTPAEPGSVAEGRDLSRSLAAAGVIAVVVGFVVELTGAGRSRCTRCGKRADRGSVLCPVHHRELARASREAVARSRREHRDW